jgi:signal transduction histidine kinase
MADDRPERLSAEELEVLAHEVRSPVAALSALSEAARAADAETLRTLLDLARAAVVDIVRLCDDGAGARLGPVVPIALGHVLGAATAPRVSISGGDGLTVAGDATRLRQAIGNVVANGVRHAARVSVVASREADDAVIEIVDDGPGVSEGIDVFQKGVSGAGSTGYGLWLARSIVEAHGGTLELVRDGAPGARFRIVLPLAPASA